MLQPAAGFLLKSYAVWSLDHQHHLALVTGANSDSILVLNQKVAWVLAVRVLTSPFK